MSNETYLQMKERQREELEAFPMAFAFSQKQLDEALAKLGAESKEDVCAIPGGGIILKANKKALVRLFVNHMDERATAYESDSMLTEAIRYELGNHEYGYTGDPTTDALRALGYDLDTITERERACFEVARDQAWKDSESWRNSEVTA